MRKKSVLLFLVTLIIFIAALPSCIGQARQSTSEVPTVSAIAQKRIRPTGIPLPGDIIMRSLYFHEERQPEEDPGLNTMEAIDTFFVNRLEWIYKLDEMSLSNWRKLRKKVAYFSAAVNLNVEDKKYVALDLSDNYMSSRHLGPDYFMGDMTQSDYYKFVLSETKTLSNLLQTKQQVPILQRDDYQGNYRFLNSASSTTREPGSFSPESVAAFQDYMGQKINIKEYIRKYLRVNGFDLDTDLRTLIYQDDAIAQFVKFSEKTTINFYQKLRADVKKKFLFSMNGGLNWSPIEKIFDYGFAEIKDYHCSPTFFHEIDRVSRSFNKFNVVTMPKSPYHQVAKDYTDFVRTCIATSYASGIPMMVPWDVYMPNQPGDVKTDRYYGTKKEYQDLYKFIARNRSLLNNYEDAFIAGYIDRPNASWSTANGEPYGELQHNVTLKKQYLDDPRYQQSSPIIINQPNFYAYGRAIPEADDRPIVIHLVNWTSPSQAQPEQLQFSLNTSRFFDHKPCKVELLIPDATQTNGTKRILLAKGNPSTITLDLTKYPLSPWGMLLISQVKDTNNSLYPPYLATPSNNLCDRNCLVSLASQNPNNPIFYRLGNSKRSQWQKYTEPFLLPNTTILEAKSYDRQQQKWSTSTAINLRKYRDYEASPTDTKILKTHYLSEIDLTSNDNSEVSFNRSVLGGKLQIDNLAYKQGISLAHSPGKSLSSLTFKKPENYNRLYLEIGIDDFAVIDPSFKILVTAKEQILYETPVFNLPGGEIQQYQRKKYFVAVRLPEATESVTISMVNCGLHSNKNVAVLGNARFEQSN